MTFQKLFGTILIILIAMAFIKTEDNSGLSFVVTSPLANPDYVPSDSTVVTVEIQESELYKEKVVFSLYGEDQFLLKGSINLKDIFEAKNNLYQVDTDLGQYELIYRGLIISELKKNNEKLDLLNKILHKEGDIEYIPYRYISVPELTSDAFLGVSGRFTYKNGPNKDDDVIMEMFISYGNCESGVNAENMNFVHSGIKILINHHKEILNAKINHSSESFNGFVFNSNLLFDINSKRAESDKLEKINQQLSQKSDVCNDLMAKRDESKRNVDIEQDLLNTLKPEVDQSLSKLEEIQTRKSLLEKEQIERDKVNNYDVAKARLDENTSSLRNYYKAFTSGILQYPHGYLCNYRTQALSYVGSINNPNLDFQIETVRSPSTCTYNLDDFFNIGAYELTEIDKVECTDCNPIQDSGETIGESVAYLERHNVSCPSGTAINAFALRNPSTGKLKVEFRCIRSLNITNLCNIKQTSWNDFPSKGGFNYLDRHGAWCEAGSAMKRWMLERNSNGSAMAITFTCCQVSGNQQTSWYRTRSSVPEIISSTQSMRFLGCFIDSYDRDLPEYVGPGNYSPEECRDKCPGYRYIGMQFHGECWCGNSTSRKHGQQSCPSDSSQNGPFYGHWNNYVYEVETVTTGFNVDTLNETHAAVAQDYAAISGFHITNDFNQYRIEISTISVASDPTNVITNSVNRTVQTDQGGNNIFFLDRQNVFCSEENTVLSSFRYENLGSNTDFQFSCTKHPKITNDCETNWTSWDETGIDATKSANFLDRHTLMCGLQAGIKGFQLERQNNLIRFRYDCCSVKDINFNYNHQEPFTENYWQTSFLDRQFPTALPSEIINQLTFLALDNPERMSISALYGRFK